MNHKKYYERLDFVKSILQSNGLEVSILSKFLGSSVIAENNCRPAKSRLSNMT